MEILAKKGIVSIALRRPAISMSHAEEYLAKAKGPRRIRTCNVHVFPSDYADVNAFRVALKDLK